MTPSRRTFAWLTGWMLGGFALALAVLPFVRDSWPAWVLPAVLTVFAASVAGPILVFGWMLGRAVAPAGGVVGVVFALGLLVGPTGQATSVPWAMWSGYAGLAAGGVCLVLLALRRRILRAWRSRRVARHERSRARRKARGERAVLRNGGATGGRIEAAPAEVREASGRDS